MFIFAPYYSTIVPKIEYVSFDKSFGLKDSTGSRGGKENGSFTSKNITNKTQEENDIILLDPDQIL